MSIEYLERFFPSFLLFSIFFTCMCVYLSTPCQVGETPNTRSDLIILFKPSMYPLGPDGLKIS